MPLPDSSETCVELSIDVQAILGLAIELPAGVQIQAKLEPGQIPNFSTILANLFGNLNAALTPLMPFFRLLDVVVALKDVSEAIPDALGPPPDPTLIIKRVAKLVKVSGFLLKLVPPLSVPIMIVGVCKVIVGGLRALREQIVQQLTVQQDIELAQARVDALAADPTLALGAASLQAALDCANANLELQHEINLATMGPLNKLLDLLTQFADLAKLPPFIKIDLQGAPELILEPLDIAITALETTCGNIPT